MASLSSLSIILIFLLFAFSIPTQSQRTQLQLTRRHLSLTDQQQSTADQALPKPKAKKKVATSTEEPQEEEQPIPKPKPKKKPAEDQEQETPKPKTKKLITEDQEQEIQKPKAKKKIAEDQEQEIPKPKSKKKIAEDQEQEIQKPKSKKIEQELDIQKPKAKKITAEDEEQEIPKPKKMQKNPTFDSKNQTKVLKAKKSNSTSTPLPTLTKSKLNKTLTLKPKNSTKTPDSPKIAKPIKLPSPKTAQKPAKTTETADPDSIWLDEPDSDSDLISEFRDLPTRIHKALIPDLKRISITSKAYIYSANKNIAENVKPFVGNKFAPKVATAASCVFLILPLCLVTLLFWQLNSYLSLQRFLIFVQAYLAIYFLTLALTAVVTGLEPLRFFYATSPSSYAWTQAVQTLGYLLYLLVQLIHLVVVFSAGENKVGMRMLGLVQMIVGLAVGCHYYAAVFHRAVTGDAPRANWKVHGVYAVCFLVICLCARAERGKKAYDGGEDGKKN